VASQPIKLGRAGHYCQRKVHGPLSCFKADVAEYEVPQFWPEDPIKVDLVVWYPRKYAPPSTGGALVGHPGYEIELDVLVEEPSWDHATFHLNLDCPDER
jgi:hypothetical protein